MHNQIEELEKNPGLASRETHKKGTFYSSEACQEIRLVSPAP